MSSVSLCRPFVRFASAMLLLLSAVTVAGAEGLVALDDDTLAVASAAADTVPTRVTTPVTQYVSAENIDSLVEARMAEFTEQFGPVDSVAADSTVRSTPTLFGHLGKGDGEEFVPDPSRVTWIALAFPGAGQIYNRKYWKLPIVYGGFLGCAYALNWNNQMYSDYSQAYLDIMDDDPNTASFEDFLPPNYNVSVNEEYLKKVFKNRKDRYRRYRDLSIFSFIGVYLVSVIDAYVDAELSHFDISEDLAVRLAPMNDTPCPMQSHSLGVGLCLNF